MNYSVDKAINDYAGTDKKIIEDKKRELKLKQKEEKQKRTS